MKKWLVLVIVVGVIGVGYYFARQQQFVPPWAQPKYAKATRGDIRVPITAAGLIHANQVIEVKSEASGKIVNIPVVEGSYVHQDDVLVELDPADEQRSLDRARAEYERAEAMLTQAEVAVERAKVNVENAKERVHETAAQLDMAEFALRKVEDTLDEQGGSTVYNAQEVVDIRARAQASRAQHRMAEIAVESAVLAERDAEAALRSQKAVVEAARKTLEDAEERLSETTIRAPAEGIVTQVYVKEGMLVQSGTQSLTGGTQLLNLADVASKKVIARLDEADYGRVLDISPIDALPEMPQLREAAADDAARLEARGGTVRITVDAFPDDEFTGRIERVEPQGKLNAGSSIIQFDVHVAITDEQRHKLPLGAQAQVEFTVESATDVLRVPAEAVKSFEDQRGVWLKTAPQPGELFGKRFVPCRFGITDGEFTQVIEVVGGGDALKEGVEVYIKLPPDDSEREP